MKLLITGGAGYIGSHVVLAGLEKGYDITIFDDLSTGFKNNISKDTKFVKGSTQSKSDLIKLFSSNNYDGVIHLAASKAAGESMLKPIKYSENNIIGGINLINACNDNNIDIIVFSSSAAVYGKPEYYPIDEMHPLKPTNFYGYTKLVIEDTLKWFSQLKDIRYAALRYFNAAGYDIQGRILEMELNPQNLIPLVMEAAVGLRKKVSIFGNDYCTKDGTGIRDYIHVSDLAKAHIDAIEYLLGKKEDIIINLGAGKGHSVLDVINKVMEISGRTIDYDIRARRLGDPNVVIAKATLAKEIIGWDSKCSDLDTIINSTWEMYKKIH